MTPSSVLAQITNTSAIGELVIHVLLPVMRKPPGTDFARVTIEPGSELRLRQSEAADPLAGSELGKVLHALRFGAVSVDRVHHERLCTLIAER